MKSRADRPAEAGGGIHCQDVSLELLSLQCYTWVIIQTCKIRKTANNSFSMRYERQNLI